MISAGKSRILVALSCVAALSGAWMSVHRSTDLPPTPAEERPSVRPTPAPLARAPSLPRRKEDAAPRPGIRASEPGETAGNSSAQVDKTDKEELAAQIDALENQLSRADAIARLNDGRASPPEREAYGAMIEELARLRGQAAEIGLAELTRELDAYTARHPERVTKYTAKQRN